MTSDDSSEDSSGRLTGPPPPQAAEIPRVTPAWLRLREPADADARARDLAERVRGQLAGTAPLAIHDLGSGTGSMTRWLAPLLPGPQHWWLYDRDADLLPHAKAGVLHAADGTPVTVGTRQRDITRLGPDDLGGAGLITASALLDMLTAAELERIVESCVDAGCPVLFTLSVAGRVELTPPEPLDGEIMAAFNAHQRRTTAGRTLLGPDATDACVAAFARHGIATVVRPSPWRLGPEQTNLIREWLAGWLDAACGQRPELAGPAAAYAAGRLTQAAAGDLRVVLEHQDLLAGRFLSA